MCIGHALFLLVYLTSQSYALPVLKSGMVTSVTWDGDLSQGQESYPEYKTETSGHKYAATQN